MDDLINRQAAIEAIQRAFDRETLLYSFVRKVAVDALKTMSSAQPEQPIEVQDVLQYLDEYLHPIVSPEHWSVYSELYDMISMLPSAQSEQKKGKWIVTGTFDDFLKCSCCGYKTPWNQDVFNFCPKCGAEMEVEE